jgi:hypothetical protein
MSAVPVDQWRITVDEDVLIFVVHPNAKYATDEADLARWRCWCVGRWIKHNAGGWMWMGMLGEITHVAPLPPIPGKLP